MLFTVAYAEDEDFEVGIKAEIAKQKQKLAEMVIKLQQQEFHSKERRNHKTVTELESPEINLARRQLHYMEIEYEYGKVLRD